jgi:hypothetical protein
MKEGNLYLATLRKTRGTGGPSSGPVARNHPVSARRVFWESSLRAARRPVFRTELRNDLQPPALFDEQAVKQVGGSGRLAPLEPHHDHGPTGDRSLLSGCPAETIGGHAIEARNCENMVKSNDIVTEVNKTIAGLETVNALTEIYEQRLLVGASFDGPTSEKGSRE